ncbi:uncharacterized protein LOC103524935 isoform X2 [Diaphorina citri]|nr:uncharacterized protein LOC103524935 isoform X2 [Diaphorina citri]
MPKEKDVKPRGRMTAYAFFVQVCREEHKKKHPEENVVFAEFSKKCAERWKTMSEKEKKRFHEMADKDKKRYDTEMQSYTPPAGEKVRGKRRKQIKDPNAPKRSLSAFFWFCNDERGKIKQDNPEYGVGDIAKELGKKWADVDPSVKTKYEQMAEKDKARYEKEMTAYKNRSVAPVNEEADEEDDDFQANLTTRGRKVREVMPESRILDNGTPIQQQDPNPRSIAQQQDPNPRSIAQQQDPNPRSIAQQQDPNPRSIAQQQDPNPRSIAQQQDIRLAEGTRDSTVIYQRQKRTKYVTLTTRSRFTPTTPSPIIRTYIAHASESGTAEKYAHRLHDILMTKFNTSRRPGRKLFSSQVVNVEALLWIDAAELVLFVASTTGEGDPPRNARRYYDNCLLFRYFDHLPYHNVYYAVLGLGSKLYKSNFCAFGVNLDKMTGDLGGTRILPVEKADTLDLEETFTRWVGAVVPHVDRICRGLPVQHVVDNSTAPPGVTEKNIMEQMNRMAATAGVSLVLTLPTTTQDSGSFLTHEISSCSQTQE